jgi:hypothetical protein
VLTTPHLKNWPCYETGTIPSGLGGSFGLIYAKEKLHEIWYSTWSIRSLCRSGSLTTVARELARCKLDLVGVHEVMWDKGGHYKSRGLYFSL